MKGLRQIIRVPWVAMKTSERILQQTGVQKSKISVAISQGKKTRVLWTYAMTTLEKDIGTMPRTWYR